MKIIVLIKEIIDTRSKITLDENNQVENNNVKFVVNIYDEYALEEAIQIREKNGGEVVIYSVGRDGTEDTINYIMSMGADRAVLIKSKRNDSISVSNLLAKIILEKDSDYDLILAGWMGIDFNRGQVPGRVSRLLDIPFVNVAVHLDIKDNVITCEREGEYNNEIIETYIPALISVQRGINEPRYPSIYNIMNSKEDKIEIINEMESDISNKPKSKFEYPKKKNDVFMIDGDNPDEAVEILLNRMMNDKLL